MNIQYQKWHELLIQAVNQPGLILRAYSSFHHYSLSNQLSALLQCQLRNIPPGPINTYLGWQKLNRQVRKGERAIELCIPLARKRKAGDTTEEEIITGFVWKPRFFVLSQTDGQSIPAFEIPSWDKDRALAALSIKQIDFTLTNGNVQGFSMKREIAISPLAAIPHKTLFHEIAHIELGHTLESDFSDAETTPRNLREVEAEAVSWLLCESLELSGAEFARGYIQSWLKNDVIPEKSAQKIFGAADRILRAGRED
jgi:N-terminal domain of anti-restriction factor ArdC